MKEIIFQTNSITKSYKTTTAVDHFDMTVYKGDIYGLIGKNGAGKTTLIRMITGLSIPDSGQIHLFGKGDQKGIQQGRKRIGSVIENPAFYPKLSAKKNLEYYRIFKGITDKKAVEEVLDLVGLNDTGEKKFKDFSLGMKQRLGLALALLDKPDFIILDEPTNGLDPFGIIAFRETILDLNRTHGITFMISSHLLTELSLVANRYGIINNGKLIQEISHVQLEEACKTGLSIKVDSTVKAIPIIEQHLNTQNFKVINEKEIRLYDFVNDSPRVIETLTAHGVKIISLNEIGDNLEAYFVALVEEVK